MKENYFMKFAPKLTELENIILLDVTLSLKDIPGMYSLINGFSPKAQNMHGTTHRLSVLHCALIYSLRNNGGKTAFRNETKTIHP